MEGQGNQTRSRSVVAVQIVDKRVKYVNRVKLSGEQKVSHRKLAFCDPLGQLSTLIGANLSHSRIVETRS